MIKSLRDAPIKSKLNVVIMLTCSVVLILLSIAYGIYDVTRFKADMVDDLLIISRTIGMNSTASIIFNDRDAARETLSSLSADEHITFAMIIIQDRTVFAYYSRGEKGSSAVVSPLSHAKHNHISFGKGNEEGYHFSDSELEVMSNIYLDNDVIGELVIWKDIVELRGLINNYIAMSTIFLVAFLFLAYALSSRLQGLISRPIISLNEVMKEVTEKGSFSLRGQKEGDDEVGALIDGFNEMLSHIQVRDGKLKKHGEMLEKEVANRTHQLEATNKYLEKAVAELLEAKAVAEAASKAKSQFLANVSHEIRTPMHGVLGMTELLMSTDLSQNQKRLAETVTRSGRSLLNIINDILDFSKIEAGKLTLEKSQFDLYQTVEEVVDIYSQDSFGKGVELIYNIPPDVPEYVIGDSNRLGQILSNLLNNAVKFTSEGEIAVELSLGERTPSLPVGEGEVEICFSVRDTGIGIPEASLETIFDSFTQVDGSLRRSYGGTGLGLSIVRQLVELMGGKVWVESEVGKGTRVWFTIMAGMTDTKPTLLSLARADMELVKLLVVDDNDTNRRYLEQVLSNWGLKAGMASSGQEALDLMSAAAEQEAPYDITVMDMMMPGMDGLELAGRIKKDPALRSTEIVMLSSVDVDSVDAGSLVSCILTKPVRQSQLYSCLSTVILSTGKASPHAADTAHEAEIERLPAGLQILVAEDNPVNQLVAEQMLTGLGCEVGVVGNGAAVLEALSIHDYDMIFMDCQMPEMDGFEATARIREGEEQGIYARRHVIVALTAHAMKSDKDRCIKAGMDDYLSKPFNSRDLSLMVTKLLFPEGEERGPYVLADEHLEDFSGCDETAQPGFSEAASPAGPIDESYLAPFRNLGMKNNGSLLNEIIGTYLSSSEELMDILSAAVEGADAVGITKAAHSLKSSSHQVGAVRLAAMCKDMEFLGRGGELSGAPVTLDAIQSEYSEVSRCLTDSIEGGGDGAGS